MHSHNPHYFVEIFQSEKQSKCEKLIFYLVILVVVLRFALGRLFYTKQVQECSLGNITRKDKNHCKHDESKKKKEIAI